MKNIQLHISRYLLLFGLFSILVIVPSELRAQNNIQSPFEKAKHDNNDDKQLCAAVGKLKDDKYCELFTKYEVAISTNREAAREIRNQMIDLLKFRIDRYFDAHIHGEAVKAKWFQSVLDILGIGLAFTGSIVGGARTKTVLAAVEGSFLSGRNSVNDRFYLLQIQILINKMNADRIEQWTAIVGRKKDGVAGDEFSWDSAKGELQQYLFLGSFTNAFDSLVQQTGAQVLTAQTKLGTAIVLAAGSQSVLAAKLHNFTGYITRMNVMAIKLEADIAAKQLEIVAAGAAVPLVPATVAAKIAEKAVLEAKQASLKDNYKNIFLAIKLGGDFAVIDGQLKAKYSATPAVMTPYNNVINNLTTNPSVITYQDYDLALTSINEFAGADIDLNKRFLGLLQLYKI